MSEGTMPPGAMTVIAACAASLNEAIRQRDEAIDAAHWLSTQKNDLAMALEEVRAILAPLLDEPFPNGCFFCSFCAGGRDGITALGSVNPHHDADCPVLRRDALLGRETTT